MIWLHNFFHPYCSKISLRPLMFWQQQQRKSEELAGVCMPCKLAPSTKLRFEAQSKEELMNSGLSETEKASQQNRV